MAMQAFRCVSDTGPGIPPDEKEKIFDKFYQIGEAGGAKPKGTGLVSQFAKRLWNCTADRSGSNPRTAGVRSLSRCRLLVR